MESVIRLTRDSYNTYPSDKLVVRLEGDDVVLRIDDSDREVRVSRKELAHALRPLDDE